MEILQEMKASPASSNKVGENTRPTLNTYINLISVCARCKNYTKMLDFLTEVKNANFVITTNFY